MSNYTMLYKFGKRARDFWAFSFYFILVFYVLGVFLTKQLFNSRL